MAARGATGRDEGEPRDIVVGVGDERTARRPTAETSPTGARRGFTVTRLVMARTAAAAHGAAPEISAAGETRAERAPRCGQPPFLTGGAPLGPVAPNGPPEPTEAREAAAAPPGDGAVATNGEPEPHRCPVIAPETAAILVIVEPSG